MSTLKDDIISRMLIDHETSCWEWQKCKTEFGYGRFSATRAHRVSWAAWYGPIPAGACILHRCDNPGCVNPTHLECGTRADNARQRSERGRSATGQDNGMSRLTGKEVDEIRGLTGRTQREVALMFGVHPNHIGAIWRGERWA